MQKKLLACVMLIVLCFGQAIIAKAETPNDSQTVEEAIKQGQHDVKVKSGNQSNGIKSQADMPAKKANLFVVFLKLIGALAVIIALIYFLYKVLGKKTKAFREYGAIKNIGGVSVGPNRSVQLVRVGGEILVVGVGDNVQLLKEITDESVIRDLLEKTDEPDPVQRNIKKMLDWTVDKAKKDDNYKAAHYDFKKILARQLGAIKRERSKKIKEVIRKDSNHE
ncbi:flagellar biosynthetic protein FliO [Scopulibacillus cellulosilyticus]|uniref:Flagellar protein n=1 Tax=Scopulibacillus cellulosilyticus TaxID=2665665 RepID=A0ABW2PT18_9BACL